MPGLPVPYAGRHPRRVPCVTDLLQVSRSEVDGCIVLSVNGEIDALTAPTLDAEIRAGIRESVPGLLVVDLTAVDFLGSAGLAVLVNTVKDAQQQRVMLRIVIDNSRPVVRPIEVTGLDAVLPVYDTVEHALQTDL